MLCCIIHQNFIFVEAANKISHSSHTFYSCGATHMCLYILVIQINHLNPKQFLGNFFFGSCYIFTHCGLVSYCSIKSCVSMEMAQP